MPSNTLSALLFGIESLEISSLQVALFEKGIPVQTRHDAIFSSAYYLEEIIATFIENRKKLYVALTEQQFLKQFFKLNFYDYDDMLPPSEVLDIDFTSSFF